MAELFTRNNLFHCLQCKQENFKKPFLKSSFFWCLKKLLYYRKFCDLHFFQIFLLHFFKLICFVTYHLQRWLDCRQSKDFQTIDGSEFRSMPNPFSHNDDDQRTAFHILHKQNAKTKKYFTILKKIIFFDR